MRLTLTEEKWICKKLGVAKERKKVGRMKGKVRHETCEVKVHVHKGKDRKVGRKDGRKGGRKVLRNEGRQAGKRKRQETGEATCARK